MAAQIDESDELGRVLRYMRPCLILRILETLNLNLIVHIIEAHDLLGY